MNADVVAAPSSTTTSLMENNLAGLSRHMAHMAESAIQSATSSSSKNSVDDCGSQHLMSLWRPIMCRTNQMFPPPLPPPATTRNSNPTATDLSMLAANHPYLHSSADLSKTTTTTTSHHNNNNNSIKSCLSHHNHYKISVDSHTHLASPTTSSKSIPVHCVVMNTTTPCYLSDAAMISSTPVPDGLEGGASTPNSKSTSNLTEESVDVDSYAIIPASTLFNQIVPVVLRKLGYSDDVIFNATGWLMMKNWRPLSLTQIASSDRDTVGGVLGELTTVATLRIYVRKNFSGNASHQSEMKNKVLRWLMTQSQHLINNGRFPLDEKWQQKVMRGERPNTPPADARRQFDVWFQQEMLRPSPTTTQQQQHLMTTLMTRTSNSEKIGHHHPRNSPSISTNDLSAGSLGENNNNLQLCMSSSSVGAGLHTSSSQLARDVSAMTAAPRVRMRTTFDPEQELPRLQRWFSENQHPTRFQLQLYVQELNELESRRGRKPLDVSNLVYWFKNARAAFKRAEVRGGGNSHHHQHLAGGRESNGGIGGGSWMAGQSLREGLLLSSSGGPGEEEEEESLDGDHRHRRHRMMDDDEMDHPIDDDEEEEDLDEEEEEEDASSSVSDRSRRSFSSTHPSSAIPLKLEPLDLNRSSSCDDRDVKDSHEGDQQQRANGDSEQQPLDHPQSNGVDDSGDLDDDEDLGSQVSGDSDSELEDYAENLSLSKHLADDGHQSKKIDPLLPHNTSGGSSSSQDYAAAAAVAGSSGGYSGFAGLNLSHAQLNPHGLVYMTSPYLQGIGSSLLHHQSAAAAAAAAAAGLAHHLHHQSSSSSSRGIGMDPLSLSSSSGGASDDRRKRNRTFIDPVTEVPRLEHWFSLNTHPSHSLVLRYTDELNRQPYRLKFPKLEPKNVQFWFKNRRAKCKRLKLSL